MITYVKFIALTCLERTYVYRVCTYVSTYISIQVLCSSLAGLLQPCMVVLAMKANYNVHKAIVMVHAYINCD